MSASRGADRPNHIPVFLKEILRLTAEHATQARWIYDGTFGRGGHTRGLLEGFPEAHVVACDRDLEAVEFAKSEFSTWMSTGRLEVHHLALSELSKLLDMTGKERFDLALLDLGVSSPQLDEGHRGFSFYKDGPLDMRMDQRLSITAADIVNEWSEKDLGNLFQQWGEIGRPWRVIRAIVHDRKEQPFLRTSALAELIARVEGWRHRGHHPATEYFQALRIAVNNELEEVQLGLSQLMQDGLASGGLLLVITFHSLEDRIVKQAFKNSQWGEPIFKKVIKPTEEEVAENPRSRSAKLRVFRKGSRT